MIDLKDLNLPPWVKKAWSEPLAKSDVLFRSVTAEESRDWELNACVAAGTDYAYAESYRLAGRIMAEHVINNRWDTDFLVYPIAFLYRHYVELQLKRLIPDGAFLADEPLSQTQWGLLSSSHRLNQLWAIFEPILRKLKSQFGTTADEVEALGSYIRQIHAIDEQSFSFRYLTTKSGARSIDINQLPHINIGVLAHGMEKLSNYLFGIGAAFDDAVQMKCEMEEEARAEYARYMEYYDGQ